MPDIRFATKFRSADTNEPGLVMEDDGTVWLVNPDMTRTQLTGGGGGGPPGGGGVAGFRKVSFVETAGAGTYTHTQALPAGSSIVAAGFTTTAAWDADTAELDVGVTGDPTAIASALGVQAAITQGIMITDNVGPYDATGAANFIATLVTTGAGGTTGRTVLTYAYVIPAVGTAPVKS